MILLAFSVGVSLFMDNVTQQPKKVLGIFTLSMISVSAIIALRNLPTLAKNGFSVIFILLLATLLFFIPIALSCAELASGWPKKGGIFAWVKEAFGEKSGALAVWLEWIESVVWLPTVLSFIASSFAYVIEPQLIHHRYFMLTVMLLILWGGTFLNFLSTQTSGWISTIGIITGSIIPGVAIICLGAYWVSHHPDALVGLETTSNFLEHFSSLSSLSSWAYFTAVALGFAGIEVAAFYIQDTKTPQKTFPRATFISAFIIIVIYLLGSLAISVVIPKQDLDLSAGMMQGMTVFFHFFNLPWAIPLFALFSVVGGLALLNTWIIGPSKGLLISAEHQHLPAFTRRVNRNGSPVNILLIQAGVGSLLICVNLFIPTINHFYWIFQTQAAQLILLMYFMIFCSVIKLRYSQPHTVRLYRIPGGKLGCWIIAGGGALFCVAAFLLGFIAPDEYQFINQKAYACILLAGIVFFCAPPFVWWWWKQR